jgi:hypothetical protein
MKLMLKLVVFVSFFTAFIGGVFQASAGSCVTTRTATGWVTHCF